VPSNLISIAALTHIYFAAPNSLSISQTSGFVRGLVTSFDQLGHGTAVKIERKMSHLNIAFDMPLAL